jgi:hypothetical protein
MGQDMLLAMSGLFLDLLLKVVGMFEAPVDLEELSLELLGLVVKLTRHLLTLIERTEMGVSVLGPGKVVVLVAKAGRVLAKVGDEGEGVVDIGEEGGSFVTLSL